jgi:hypothetical protein
MELGTGVIGPANGLTREVAVWCRGRLNICRTGTNISGNVGPMAVCPVRSQAAATIATPLLHLRCEGSALSVYAELRGRATTTFALFRGRC